MTAFHREQPPDSADWLPVPLTRASPSDIDSCAQGNKGSALPDLATGQEFITPTPKDLGGRPGPLRPGNASRLGATSPGRVFRAAFGSTTRPGARCTTLRARATRRLLAWGTSVLASTNSARQVRARRPLRHHPGRPTSPWSRAMRRRTAQVLARLSTIFHAAVRVVPALISDGAPEGRPRDIAQFPKDSATHWMNGLARPGSSFATAASSKALPRETLGGGKRRSPPPVQEHVLPFG
jgi:hypothetical protein